MKANLVLTIFLVATVVSCKEIEGPEGLKSLINISEEAAGSNCAAGGQRLEVGIDKNRDNVLDTNEIESVKYICNGINGLRSLVDVVNEAAGPNCINGGVKLMSGGDTNGNDLLEALEITSTLYICSVNIGSDGHSTVFNVDGESPGVNCSAGGYKIESGLDINDNLILDNSEVGTTQYICHGGPSFDKQTRLDFLFGSSVFNSSNSNTGTVLPERVQILRFNKGFYSAIDSVIFVANIWTSDANTNCLVELYNVTDNIPISGSLLSTNSTVDYYAENLGVYVFSDDIKNGLPNKEITLGLRLRSETEGVTVSIQRAHLFIYKK
ncbi:MAG TPA: hypothetical protein VK589_11945 [Chryseolinea sp.]|nr:hypothetical protein [Chryseolinea sp.]